MTRNHLLNPKSPSPVFRHRPAVKMVNTLSGIKCIAFMALFHSHITKVDSYPMNQTCSPPTSRGGNGYCGPSFCDTIKNTLPGCVFKSTNVWNYPEMVAKTQTKTCVQSTDPRCTSAALKALVFGPGIKAAYCNDAFLVLHTDLSSGFKDYLGSIQNPPASTSTDGTSCVTRFVNPDFQAIKIPLYPTILSTSDPLVNNVNTNAFPNGGANLDGAYLSTSVSGTGATMGMPTRGTELSSPINEMSLLSEVFSNTVILITADIPELHNCIVTMNRLKF